MFYIGYTQTLLDELNEDILSIMKFHEVGRALLEVLHEETLEILEFHEIGKNFLELLHKISKVVVLHEVGILYLQVHSNLLHSTYLHKVTRKSLLGLSAVILKCRYWSDVLRFYFAFDRFL